MDKKSFFYNHNNEHYCGDFIPYYDDKSETFHLFYILGNPWHHISTKDFVNYTYHRVALEGGGPNAQDRDIYTGCVTKINDLYYIYYTGHNGEKDSGVKFSEVILRATSPDLMTWTKDTEWKLEPDTEHFQGGAWRDPYIWYQEDEQKYFMIFTAADKHNISKRWGCTAMFSSDDCLNWIFDSKAYNPCLNDSHECPDMFKIGDWYYLIFSCYGRNWENKYRMSKNIRGPWIKPKEDVLDGRAYYAAKTAEGNGKRYLFGWVSRKEDEEDQKTYGWSGTLAVHEINQKPDGTLFLTMPDSVKNAFDKPVSYTPAEKKGEFEINKNEISADAFSGFSYITLGDLDYDKSYLVKGKIQFNKPESSAAGLLLRVNNMDLENYYQIRFDNLKNKLSFERSSNFFQNHKFDEERFLNPKNTGVFEFEIIVSGSMIVTYSEDAVLSARGYDLKEGKLGFFVEEGAASLIDLKIFEA